MQLIEDKYNQANEIVTSFGRELNKKPPPPLIYHYTDGTGLRGIFESGKLWFTDIFKLNDPTEVRHGLNPAIEIINQRAHNGPPELKLFSNILKRMVNEGIELTAHHFVCCFSKDAEDLGQWRAYADNGRGFVIGFDGGILVQAFIKAGNENHSTFPITYRDKRLREMQKEIIEKFIPFFSFPRGRNFTNGERKRYLTELSTSLAVPLVSSALFFKHKAYKNEKEYRFHQIYAAGPLDGVKLRTRQYSLIRYREFDWRTVAAGSLKKIIIGPGADRSLAHQFVDECLREFHQVEGVKIGQSDIPYRAL